MKIISKFKDYYDIGLTYGVDKTLIYKRIPKTIRYKKLDDNIHGPQDNINDLCETQSYGFIGFCGKIYPTFLLMSEGLYRGMREFDGTELVDAACTTQQFIDLVFNKFKEIHNTKSMKTFLNNFNSNRSSSSWWNSHNYRMTKDSFEQYSNDIIARNKLYSKNINDLFFEFESPIFRCDYIGRKAYITTNPNLKSMGFSSIVNTYTAFQEVSMFLGGVLGETKDIVQITDDIILRNSKGFDKMSFKKRPRQ